MELNNLIMQCRSNHFLYSKKTLFIVLIIFLSVSFSLLAEKNKETLPAEIKQQLLLGQFSKAVTQLKLLSNKGHTVAQYQLALIYLAGNGVVKSQNKAIKLLKLSAEDNSKASYLLANLYLKMSNKKSKNQLAIKYLTKASNLGNKQATSKLSELRNFSRNTGLRPQTQALFEIAIASGDLELVIKQFLKGANLDQINRKGNPPIITSLQSKGDDIFLWLMNQKILFEQTDRSKNSALHILAKFGKLELIVKLNKHLSSLDTINNQGQTALHIALINRNLNVVQWLLNHDANYLIKDFGGVTAKRYAKIHGVTLKKQLAINEDSKAKRTNDLQRKQIAYSLKKLIQTSQQKNSTYFNWPLLHIAIAQQQSELALSLLDSGNSPWELNSRNETAIEIAIRNKNFKLSNSMLMKSPIHTNQGIDSIKSLLLYSVSTQSAPLIKSLVKQSLLLNIFSAPIEALKKSITIKNILATKTLLKFNHTVINKELFLSSILFIDTEIMELFISKGAKLNWRNSKNESILILTSKNSNDKIIQFLLSQDIELNQTDNLGLTPLMWSVKQKCVKCVQLLLDNNALVDLQSNLGNTATMLASTIDSDILELLLSKTDELSIRNNNNLTALMIAVKNKCYRCTKSLLDYGANPRRKNDSGQSSFDLAVGKEKYLSLLEQH